MNIVIRIIRAFKVDRQTETLSSNEPVLIFVVEEEDSTQSMIYGTYKVRAPSRSTGGAILV